MGWRSLVAGCFALGLLAAPASAVDVHETDIPGSVATEVIDLFAESSTAGCTASARTAAASVLGGTRVSGEAETFAALGATQSRATGCLNRACAKSASIGDGCD